MSRTTTSVAALGAFLIPALTGACQGERSSTATGAPSALAAGEREGGKRRGTGQSSKEQPEEEQPEKARDPYAPAAMPSVRADTLAKAPADPTLENEKTGIAACDAYIRAMNGCYLPKVSPELRDEILAAMKQERFAWKEAGGGDPDGVAKKCAQAMRDRSSLLKQAGCL